MFDAALFAWVQGADFYRFLHAEAVDSVPPGNGRFWIDAGCGPGLVSRLAALHGYRVEGIDRSPAMIYAARWLSRRLTPAVTFAVGNAVQIPAASADVVSAASLLAVLGDKRAALLRLWDVVRPGGRLLIVEPTSQMTSERARRVIAAGNAGRRALALRLWAAARQGRAVDPSIYDAITPAAANTVPLLDGMVEARVFVKGLERSIDREERK